MLNGTIWDPKYSEGATCATGGTGHGTDGQGRDSIEDSGIGESFKVEVPVGQPYN